jgi:hypothetical protein
VLREDVPRNFDPVVELLFGENMADVIFHSTDADPKFRSDIFVTQARSDSRSNSFFCFCQILVSE